jgi:hypothetical protein
MWVTVRLPSLYLFPKAALLMSIWILNGEFDSDIVSDHDCNGGETEITCIRLQPLFLSLPMQIAAAKARLATLVAARLKSCPDTNQVIGFGTLCSPQRRQF